MTAYIQFISHYFKIAGRFALEKKHDICSLQNLFYL